MNKIKVGDVFLEATSLIAQTLNVNNLGDIKTRQGGSSNNFTIPLTSLNRNALGFPEDINETNRNPYKKIDASLYDGNTYLRSGYLKINSVDQTEIKVTFFSDNVGWFNEIKDKTIKELLTLNEYDHLYSEANVTGSFTNTEGYIYPLIEYGEFRTFDLNDAIEVEQLFTGFYLKTIFERIFTEAGYTIEGELLDLWEYNNSIIPFSAEDFVHGQQYIEDNTVEIAFPNLNPSTFTFTTGGPAEIIFFTNTLTPPSALTPNEPGTYLVTVEVDISNFNIAALQTANIIVYRDGFSLTPTVVEPFFTFVSTSTDGLYSLTKEVFLDPVTDFDLRVGVTYTTSGTIFDVDGNDSFFRLVPSASGRIVEDSTVNIVDILPDINQSDFVKYVFNTFGVIAQTDNVVNTVSMNLFKNIKGRVLEAKDWSDKLDTEQTREVDFTELVGDYANISIFEYIIDDNDQELVTYKSQNKLDFGFGTLEIDNEHISNRKTVYDAPFGSTINIVSFLDATNPAALYIPQIRWLDADGEKDVTPVPRVLLILREQTVTELTGGEFNQLTIGATVETEIPFCWFVKAPYTATTDQYTQSLSFGDITFTDNLEGTISMYWGEYSTVLSNMKYLDAAFALNAVDVGELDFKVPIYIDRYKSYFYVNSVNEYSGSEQLTRSELIKIA